MPAFVGVRRGPLGPIALLEACFWERLEPRYGVPALAALDDPRAVLAIVVGVQMGPVLFAVCESM